MAAGNTEPPSNLARWCALYASRKIIMLLRSIRLALWVLFAIGLIACCGTIASMVLASLTTWLH